MTTLTLTAEFSDALEKLHAGVPVFLTGRAGTGKSTLIRRFLEDTSRRVVVAAPTGIAALNVGGYTLHRLFSFPAGITPEQVRSGDYRPGRFMKTLKALDTLVIDEISMVRADLFDCLVLALEQFGPKPGTPLGGVQLVLVGDLHQLPPVVTEPEREHFQTYYESPFFFSGHKYAESSFAVVELTTVFRQLNDTRMVEILNAVRDGGLLEDARTELNRHTDPEFEPPLDEFWLTLATTNRIAGARNKRMLERLPAPAAYSTAAVTGILDGMERPAEDVLAYKSGAQIMLLTNDPADRWVNGTLAKITETLFDDDGEPYVVVELPDGTRASVERHLWEVTRPSVAGGQLTHEVVGTFTQLPFRLAWAITIHKSQGQTLDRVVVDLTGGTFADGQLYVALSRCRSLDGMVLTRNVLPKDLRVDQRVRRFLRAQAPALETRGNVYLGICWVGDEGSRWKPRPIEIAVVTDDGQQASTLVNPTRDLGSARTDYGITAADVELAPLLEQAWAAMAPLLSERTPVGLDVDLALSRIDFELKRNGHVARMPLGTELDDGSLTWSDRDRLSRGTALERALTVRDLAVHRGLTGAEPFPTVDDRAGYLLPRSASASVELLVHAPGLAASDDDRSAALTQMLRGATERAALSPTARGVLRSIEEQLGTSILSSDDVASADLSELLSPGARVCFTGTAHDARGRELQRWDVESMAMSHGLFPVANVTKTRCDVLVVAELGTQSGKARNAAKFGKPIIDFADFLSWADGTAPSIAQTPADSPAADLPPVTLTPL